MTSVENSAPPGLDADLVAGLVGAVPGPAALLCAHSFALLTVNEEFGSRFRPEEPLADLVALLEHLDALDGSDSRAVDELIKLTPQGELAPITRRLRDGHPVQVYSRRVTPDHHLLRVEIIPVSGSDYGPIAGLEAAPVTVVSLVEALHTAPVPLLILDPLDRITAWNQGFLQINEAAPLEVGITFSELLHRYDAMNKGWDLVGPTDASIPWIEERLRRHRDYQGAFEEAMGDGRWFLTSEHRAADGSTLVMHVDITRQKKAAEEVALAREQAEAANRAKSDFLALMSHDLRTPLNSILGFSEVIRDDVLHSGLSLIYRDYANDIHTSGQHLLELVNTILDLAKIEAGRFELNDEISVLAQDIEAALRLLRDRFSSKGIKLGWENTLQDLTLLYDRRCLRQILMNLLSNAEKFTPSGGRVTVRLDRAEGDVRIVVADTGPGIDEADLETVLEPFNQGKRDPDGSGTGLGLPLVKSLTERHGGAFELRSEVGRGTIASVRFPGWRVQAKRAK